MIVLNELSFAGQAESIADADALMRACAVLLHRSRRRQPGSVIASHRTLYQRRLLSGMGLPDLLFRINEFNKDTALLFLRLTRAGPFTDTLPSLSVPGCTCVYHRKIRSGHPVVVAAHGMAELVSVRRSGVEASKTVNVLFCMTRHAMHEVNHLVDPEDLPFYKWNYAPSPKHARGGAGTFMDLDDQVAQMVLDGGIEDGRIVYGYHQEKYYKFHPDNFAGYHGYPVEIREVPIRITARLQESLS